MRKVWALSAVVEASAVRVRLDSLAATRANDADMSADAVEAGIRAMLDRVDAASQGKEPRARGLSNWWRGTLIDIAFQNLHAAKAEMALLYDEDQLRAELPSVVAKTEAVLAGNDPRRLEARSLLLQAAGGKTLNPAAVRKAIEVGYAASDEMHTRVRSFRNVVIISGLVLLLLLVGFAAYVASNPTAVPFCFLQLAQAGAPAHLECPTSANASGPGGQDVVVVAVLGVVGAALAGAVSIRGIRGTSTPYDVPVALAFLKIPAGGLTAVAALIAIRGAFVPGLSTLDSQEQILAYALVFGYAQQLLTRLVDRQGQSILSGIASKDPQSAPPGGSAPTATPDLLAAATQLSPPGPSGAGGAAPPGEVAAVSEATDDEPADLSDVEDPEPRDVQDAGVIDDSGSLEDDATLDEVDDHDDEEPPDDPDVDGGTTADGETAGQGDPAEAGPPFPSEEDQPPSAGRQP